MSLPVWVTVIISRYVGGFLVGATAGVLVTAIVVSHPAGAAAPFGRGDIAAYALLAAGLGALVSGVVTTLLLPHLSGVRAGMGTVVFACFVGNMVQMIGATLLLSAVIGSPQAAMYAPIYAASPVVTLGLTVVGVALTSWIISAAAQPDTSRGSGVDRYGPPPPPSGYGRDW